MKISNILIAFTFLFAIACNSKQSNEQHGHSHDTESHAHPHNEATDDHGHNHEDIDHGHEHHEQEEFTIGIDSTHVKEEGTHIHEDGSTHHNH